MKAISLSQILAATGAEGPAAGTLGAHGAKQARGRAAGLAAGTGGAVAFADVLGEALAGKGGVKRGAQARAQVGAAVQAETGAAVEAQTGAAVQAKVGAVVQGQAGAAVQGQAGAAARAKDKLDGVAAAEGDLEAGAVQTESRTSSRKKVAGASAEVDAAAGAAAGAASAVMGVHGAVPATHAAVPAPAQAGGAKAAPAQDGAVARTVAGAGKLQLAVPGPGKPVVEKEREKEKVRDPKAAEPPVAARADASPALVAPGETRAPAPPIAAPSEPPPPLPPPPSGQELQGAVLRSAAHLTLDAGALGSIELHLRVREGAVYLRVEGDAARVVEARAGELSRALARDGLTLAPLEPSTRDAGTSSSGEGGRGYEERRDAWREATDARDRGEPGPEARRRSGSAGNATRNHHVKA